MKWVTKLKFGWSVLRYRVTGRNRPVAVAWLITGRCNFDCVYCKWKHVRSADELGTDAVLDMIDQMKAAGVLLLSFTGGEPLLRDDIGAIVRHVKRRGLVCKLNTNGTLLERRLSDLKGLDLLQISIDGPPSIQDRLRGAETSDRALRAVQLAREAGIKVQTITCLTRDNVARLDELLDFGLRNDLAFCFQVLTQAFMAEGEADEAVPARADLTAALERLLALKQSGAPRAHAIGSSAGELRYYLAQFQADRQGCDCALVTATMLPDGGLIFCGNARDYAVFDAVELGFEQAFSRLRIPACAGCVCVGKLRLSKAYQLDGSVIRELLRL